MFHPQGPSLRELLGQGFSSLERGYDRLAPKFDLTPFRTPDEVVGRTVEALPKVPRGLDLCCGTGAGMLGLRSVCTDEIVGVDLSAGMLEAARVKLNARDLAAATDQGTPPPRLTLVQGDVLNLPYTAEFDVATCFGALGHIPRADEPRFVQSVRRALRPGGKFVFVTTDRLPWTDPALWIAHGFNLGWRVRNALFRPPFIMYYLTFTVPDAARLLEAEGFDVEVRRGWFAPKYRRLCLVIATRR